jgi:hypothetical protein
MNQLLRSQKQTFIFETEVSAKFASPEDNILAKLEWYSLGGKFLSDSGVIFLEF